MHAFSIFSLLVLSFATCTVPVKFQLQVVPKVKGHQRAAEQLYRVKPRNDKLKSDLTQAEGQVYTGCEMDPVCSEHL